MEKKELHRLIYTVLRLLMYCNFTFNFVLYFVCGTLFKQEWKALTNDICSVLRALIPNRHDGTDQQTTGTGSSNPF